MTGVPLLFALALFPGCTLDTRAVYALVPKVRGPE